MKIVTTTEITERQIADQMVTAIEGGINYWCKGIYLEAPEWKKAAEGGEAGCWYDNPEIYKNPELRIRVTLSEPAKGNKLNYILGMAEIENGFKVMSQLKHGEGGHHWRDMLDETGDATTADVWLQCCLFGEIVF